MNKSLLPPNANPQENALSEATARAGEVPVTFQTLWQADHCPLHLLPWLAWTLSVDEWDEHWDEQTKRQVIKNSIKVHQHKGTIGAVKKALAALHVRTEIKEWFETGGEPYTFRVTAYANDNLNTPGIILNKALINQIRTTIESTKNTRSHFDFRLGAKFNTGIAVGCTARNLTIFRATCAPVIEQPVTAGIGTAAVVRPLTIIRV